MPITTEITQTITELPAPPQLGQSSAVFSENADNFVAALPDMGTQLNTLSEQINALALDANTLSGELSALTNDSIAAIDTETAISLSDVAAAIAAAATSAASAAAALVDDSVLAASENVALNGNDVTLSLPNDPALGQRYSFQFFGNPTDQVVTINSGDQTFAKRLDDDSGHETAVVWDLPILNSRAEFEFINGHWEHIE